MRREREVGKTRSPGEAPGEETAVRTGGVPPYAHRLSCTPALPSELSFDTETGLLFGVPPAPSDAVCRWSVIDADTPPSRRHGSFPVDVRSSADPLRAALHAASFDTSTPPVLALSTGVSVSRRLIDASGGIGRLSYSLGCALLPRLHAGATDAPRRCVLMRGDALGVVLDAAAGQLRLGRLRPDRQADARVDVTLATPPTGNGAERTPCR